MTSEASNTKVKWEGYTGSEQVGSWDEDFCCTGHRLETEAQSFKNILGVIKRHLGTWVASDAAAAQMLKKSTLGWRLVGLPQPLYELKLKDFAHHIPKWDGWPLRLRPKLPAAAAAAAAEMPAAPGAETTDAEQERSDAEAGVKTEESFSSDASCKGCRASCGVGG